MKAKDEKFLSPSERAELVNSFLFHALKLTDPSDAVEHPLYWDLLSWCVEMLNLYSYQLAISGEPGLYQAASKVNSGFYSLHYSLPDDSPELGLARDDHKALWISKIEELT